MVSLLLATVPLFLWLTAMCPVEWKYNMMRLVLLEVIKPGTKDLGNKVKQLKYTACSSKDAQTTSVNECATNLKTAYVNLLKNKAAYNKYNANLTDYVSQKIGQVLAVTELIKGDKCIQADVPVVPKKNDELLTSFGLLEEALKIYVKIANTMADVKDYREAVAELLKTLLTDLTGKIKTVVDEGVKCSDVVPTLIHHPHVTHSHKVFTETMNSVMAVFTFLSDDLKYATDAFGVSVASIKTVQNTIVGQFDSLEELCSGGRPTSVWPVLEFGKLEAYKMAADVFQMKQPTGCALNNDGKESDAMINKLKDLVNNMKKFNMELPSTRYSMKKNSGLANLVLHCQQQCNVFSAPQYNANDCLMTIDFFFFGIRVTWFIT
ncbi:hypothetical protein CRM22_003659 [Opisthorchis felineus]|uniref:Uncharacterized protein n=1 Tax=Opisthorchis felineus TaxID=147828 RepID=A0A4S2M064_OPIFE|nr:hypothetical protein CRM22_003659 [Opisthorchis felineus]